jgi:hypothetical protein
VRRGVIRVAGRRVQQRRPIGLRNILATGNPDFRIANSGYGAPGVVAVSG